MRSSSRDRLGRRADEQACVEPDARGGRGDRDAALPIRGIHSNPCGGITIIAERNLQLVDGGLLRVEVQDANGGFNSCGGNADDITFVKRVKVLVSERGLRDRVDALSVFSGFPLSQ